MCRVLRPGSKSRKILIEDIRSVEPFLALRAAAGETKLVIILEADRMMEEAANAFLKTLEEPPPQTVIILITEQPSRLLTTILSRCVRVPLHEAGNTLHLSEAQQAFLPAVTAALPLIGSDVAALALRADFQALLAERKEQITKRLTAAIKAEAKAIAEGTDIRDWEARQKDATAALIETEYLAEREQMLELLSLCLGQAVLLSSHAPDVHPLAPEIASLSTARPVADLLRRMRALEALRTDLNFNVNEALTLDSHLLNIIGNNTL
jgi:DNA polymerase-3 subunit delta'